MVGNSLDWMFLAQSSYLEIDTIFIKNNTFSQIIRAVKCNVSFESMKIRGNHCVCYSVGRMANTYMENSDNFVDYAFTTTCTYLGKRYFPFEITNTEIVWNNAVQVSSLPIIDLSGNISLSNVKLLITSLFETEIMQYSTKDVPLLVNRFLKTFPNIFFILPLFIVETP